MQQCQVASVSVNDEGAIVVEHLVELCAALFAGFDNLNIQIIGHGFHSAYGGASSTHNHHVFHIDIMFLTHDFAHVGNVLPRGHDVNHVVELQFVVTTRDDGVAVAFDSHHMIRVVGAADVLEWLVEHLARFAQLDAQHHQSTIVHVPALAHPAHLQSVDNIGSGQHFRIDNGVDAQLVECLHERVGSIFVVVYLGHSFLCSERFSQGAAHDVFALIGCDGDKEVGIFGTSLFECLQAGARCLHHHQVEVGAELF